MQGEAHLYLNDSPCKNSALPDKKLREIRTIFGGVQQRHSSSEVQPVEVANQIAKVRPRRSGGVRAATA